MRRPSVLRRSRFVGDLEDLSNGRRETIRSDLANIREGTGPSTKETLDSQLPPLLSAKRLQICLQEGVDVLGHQDDIGTPQLTDEKALWQGPGCAQFDDANPILGFEEIQGFLGISSRSPAGNDESLWLLGTQILIEFRSLEYVAATMKLGPKFAVKG